MNVSIGRVWGTDATSAHCPYCGKGPHQITFEKYSPNKRVTAHFECRWCGQAIRLELPGNIVKIEPVNKTGATVHGCGCQLVSAGSSAPLFVTA
jgi:hypothetical protein